MQQLRETPLWNKLVLWLRSRQVGDIITRQEVLKVMGIRTSLSTYNTLDSYRAILLHSGYLSYITRGQYRKTKPIPLISLRECKNRAYVERWKSWFVEDEDAL
jgi:hypothetical protein